MIAMDMWEDAVDPEMEAREHELGAFGDPRRCPRHPTVQTSSHDGMFDAPCGMCEGESEDAAHSWQYDAENPHREFCALPEGPSCVVSRWSKGCNDVDEEIPF